MKPVTIKHDFECRTLADLHRCCEHANAQGWKSNFVFVSGNMKDEETGEKKYLRGTILRIEGIEGSDEFRVFVREVIPGQRDVEPRWMREVPAKRGWVPYQAHYTSKV